MSEPREPNQEEITQLACYLYSSSKGGIVKLELEEAKLLAEGAYVAVFDDYITDCPGYAGKLMMVVWGWPDLHEVFIWRDGELTHVN